MKAVTFFNSIMIATTFTQSLLCMEIWHNPTTKDDIHCTLAQYYFSHDSICALALVNKQWNTFIKETAEKRQQLLIDEAEYSNLSSIANFNRDEQLIWHTHKSAYAYWFNNNKDCPKKHHQMIFSLVYSKGNNTFHIQTSKSHAYRIGGKRHKGHTKVKIIQKPFFTMDGDISFHTFQFYGDYNVVENLLSTKRSPKKFYCLVNCLPKNLYNVEIPCLSIFKNYPTLMYALTRSKFKEYDNDFKIYDLGGVELDEDYLLHGVFPPLFQEREQNKYSFKRIHDNNFVIARRMFLSRCIIKKPHLLPKIFLLFCAQQDKKHTLSQLSTKAIALITDYMIMLEKDKIA